MSGGFLEDWTGLPVQIDVPEVEHHKICICGHPISRHALAGTEYARCRMWNSRVVCACSMAGREVVEAWGGDKRHLTTTHRGGQIPHALNQGVERYVSSGGTVVWLVHNCDRCGVAVEDGLLRAVALNSRGVVMLGFKPVSKFDSGKHLLLCPGCWESEMAANLATPDREYGRLDGWQEN